MRPPRSPFLADSSLANLARHLRHFVWDWPTLFPIFIFLLRFLLHWLVSASVSWANTHWRWTRELERVQALARWPKPKVCTRYWREHYVGTTWAWSSRLTGDLMTPSGEFDRYHSSDISTLKLFRLATALVGSEDSGQPCVNNISGYVCCFLLLLLLLLEALFQPLLRSLAAVQRIWNHTGCAQIFCYFFQKKVLPIHWWVTLQLVVLAKLLVVASPLL